MGIHLDKRKSTISLESGLNNVSEVLEQRNKVVLGRVRSKVPDVTGRLPLRRLLNDHIIALNTVGWEMVMTERSRWCHTHSSHSLLLGN